MRKPLFIVSVLLLLVAWALEAGSSLFFMKSNSLDVNGYAIPALALFDSLLVLTVALIGAPFVFTHAAVGKFQGIVTFFVAVSTIGASFVMIFKCISMLFVMFGTLVVFFPYAFAFASFGVAESGLILLLVLFLKLGFLILLILSHQRFLTNIGLLRLIAYSILLTLLASFMHGLPPSFLASITDDLAGIAISLVSLFVAIKFLLSSLPAVRKAIAG